MDQRLVSLRLKSIESVGELSFTYSTVHTDTKRDAITPTQDWLITPHTHCTNLYIAGGGSFHAFKFLPILGREIVAMIDGTLNEEKAHRWSWNRTVNAEKGACDSYFPKRDLKDIIASSDRIKSRA
jgi:sarcosine oxidase/L-pipecolate oxidase